MMSDQVISSTMREDVDYDAFLIQVQMRFSQSVGEGKTPLFTTDVENLFDVYLGNIPETERQHYNCRCCRNFINRFGGLVTIDDEGMAESAIWDLLDAPALLRSSVAQMAIVVERSRVNGVFISSETVYGTPVTAPWRHLSVTPPDPMRHVFVTQTAFQKSAEKTEDFKNICVALSGYQKDQLQQAVKLLQTDSLYRSEKCLGQAEWLLDLFTRTRFGDPRRPKGTNPIWKAVATAPSGFCHPRSSMIGELLDDIGQGLPFEDVARKFKSKMHPLQYQRPQAAPKYGAIAEAEKIVERLGAAGALQRRFCRLDEVQALWRPVAPKTVESPSGGVFGHLKAKESAPIVSDMSLPVMTMTWEKFRRLELPEATTIEIEVPSRGTFSALVTAVNPDAPPILQWDTPEFRNPVSWYLWHNGSYASEWGLTGNSYAKVSAVAFGPSQWRSEDDCPHQSKRVFFLIDGAKETKQSGLALFPEILKAEFHGIRSVLEAYSKSGKIEGMDEPHACGLLFHDKGEWEKCLLRVTKNGMTYRYKIDRWD